MWGSSLPASSPVGEDKRYHHTFHRTSSRDRNSEVASEASIGSFDGSLSSKKVSFNQAVRVKKYQQPDKTKKPQLSPPPEGKLWFSGDREPMDTGRQVSPVAAVRDRPSPTYYEPGVKMAPTTVEVWDSGDVLVGNSVNRNATSYEIPGEGRFMKTAEEGVRVYRHKTRRKYHEDVKVDKGTDREREGDKVAEKVTDRYGAAAKTTRSKKSVSKTRSITDDDKMYSASELDTMFLDKERVKSSSPVRNGRSGRHLVEHEKEVKRHVRGTGYDCDKSRHSYLDDHHHTNKLSHGHEVSNANTANEFTPYMDFTCETKMEDKSTQCNIPKVRSSAKKYEVSQDFMVIKSKQDGSVSTFSDVPHIVDMTSSSPYVDSPSPGGRPQFESLYSQVDKRSKSQTMASSSASKNNGTISRTVTVTREREAPSDGEPPADYMMQANPTRMVRTQAYSYQPPVTRVATLSRRKESPSPSPMFDRRHQTPSPSIQQSRMTTKAFDYHHASPEPITEARVINRYSSRSPSPSPRVSTLSRRKESPSPMFDRRHQTLSSPAGRQSRITTKTYGFDVSNELGPVVRTGVSSPYPRQGTLPPKSATMTRFNSTRDMTFNGTDSEYKRGGLAAAYQSRQKRASSLNRPMERSYDSGSQIRLAQESDPVVLYIPAVSHHARKAADDDDRLSGINLARNQSFMSKKPPSSSKKDKEDKNSKKNGSRVSLSRKHVPADDEDEDEIVQLRDENDNLRKMISKKDLKRSNSIPKDTKFPWLQKLGIRVKAREP
ncbi:hypothetical protein HDE_09943 [Halotydeus destructor]|nr:hypothetical protein HDE_09943 [Halotydeus destructor]